MELVPAGWPHKLKQKTIYSLEREQEEALGVVQQRAREEAPARPGTWT
jgi:hypothetical protein